MTNAAVVATLAADRIADMTSYLAELETERDGAGRMLTSTPFVIGFGNGIYIGMNADDTVKGVKLLRGAVRFSRTSAENATANGNIQNGGGEIAFPIGFIDALDAEIKRTKFALDYLNGLTD